MIADPKENPGETQAQRLEKVSELLATVLRPPDVTPRLRTAPGENEWSALQVVGHMAEMIPYWLSHCQTLIAASGEPPHFGRTLDAPERLAGVAQGTRGDLDELLRVLTGEIERAVTTIRSLSEAERGKKGVHLRHGEMTVAEVIERFIVAHAEEHLAQVQAVVQTRGE